MLNFRTFNLAVEFYRHVQKLKLPKHLSDQLQRAVSSVALNLAEGSGRGSLDDRRRFYQIAFGSLRESQSILILAGAPKASLELADKLAAHNYKLIKNCQ